MASMPPGRWWGPRQWDATYHAFLYSGGDYLKNLGTLPSPYNINSYAYGINAAGQVAGYSTNLSGTHHAFFYNGSSMVDLSPLLGSDYSEALGINDAGQVVGWCYTGSPSHKAAFVYDSVTGTVQFPGTLGGNSSIAWGINAAGQAVGQSTTAPPSWDHAFLWQSGVGMLDLGTLGPTDPDTDSVAYAVNAAGQVVGRSDATLFSSYHAFLWKSGVGMQDLGVLSGATSGSYAYGINSAGQVVGLSGTASGTNHGFLYSGGVMLDLNNLVKNLPADTVLIRRRRHQRPGADHRQCQRLPCVPADPDLSAARRRSAAAGLEVGGAGSPLMRRLP